MATLLLGEGEFIRRAAARPPENGFF